MAPVSEPRTLARKYEAYAAAALDYEFIKADSIALTPVEKARIRKAGAVPVFFVDGCHTAEHSSTISSDCAGLSVAGRRL